MIDLSRKQILVILYAVNAVFLILILHMSFRQSDTWNSMNQAAGKSSSANNELRLSSALISLIAAGFGGYWLHLERFDLLFWNMVSGGLSFVLMLFSFLTDLDTMRYFEKTSAAQTTDVGEERSTIALEFFATAVFGSIVYHTWKLKEEIAPLESVSYTEDERVHLTRDRG